MMLAALLASVVCAATPVHAEPLPKSGSLAQLKWVQATPHHAGIVGMLFAYDAKIAGDPPHLALWAGGEAPPPGPNQKILWFVRNTHASGALVVRGFELGGMDAFRQSFPRTGDWLAYRSWPSIVDIPSAGCWRLDITIGAVKGSLVVEAVRP